MQTFFKFYNSEIRENKFELTKELVCHIGIKDFLELQN